MKTTRRQVHRPADGSRVAVRELGITSIELVMAMVMIVYGVLAFASVITKCMTFEQTLRHAAVVHNTTRDVAEQVATQHPDLLELSFGGGALLPVLATSPVEEDSVEAPEGPTMLTLDRISDPSELQDFTVAAAVPQKDASGVWDLGQPEWAWLADLLSAAQTMEDTDGIPRVKKLLETMTPVRVRVSWRTERGVKEKVIHTIAMK